MGDCKHVEGRGHDCDYVDWRNSLLESAEGVADAEAGPEPSDDTEVHSWSVQWDAAFHRAMRRLTGDAFSPARRLA